MALPGPRRDLRVSTRTEETEGTLSTVESPQKTRQHPQESQDMRTKKMRSAVVTAQQREVPRCRRTTQRVVGRRMECCGPGLHCARRIFGRRAQKPKELEMTW
ncbi:hypothetical protein NDU88_004049 [Pleurodeles waltl]|uniref:Uncharacterized protein n=1 Tax=Pleurodeles waltl TaxID=8319 RepID=A0AAV7LH04_PLEWA|nr:hypothetical protein NDU88_004049 [Pleurodeles waltl]